MPRQKPKAKMDAYEAVFTALAHPVRRRILVTLHVEGGSMTAGEIAAMFAHAWPTTTGHLRVLESAGLLHHDRQDLYFMCGDLKGEISALAQKGVSCSDVQEARWGSIVKVRLPGGGEVGLYQPKHPTALTLTSH